MKKLKLTLSIIAFLMCTICFAQTPEEKKQIEKAKRMQDSIMNLPAFKEAMKKAKNAKNMIPGSIMQMGEAENKKKKAKKVAEEKRRKIENEKAFRSSISEVKTKDNANTFYWLGTIASNTQGKFSNWSFGKADLKVKVYNQESKTRTYLKIGEISAKGQVTISLPKIDFRKWERRPITSGHSEGDDLFNSGDRLGLEYSNKNVTYFATRFGISVMQGDKNLGNLSVANSVVTRGNLNAPCCSNKGGDGYIAYWVYMSQANIVKEREDNPNEAVDTNLNLKKGWNIVITRVAGKKEPNDGEFSLGLWKNKYHTATTTMPTDAKFYFSSHLVEDK